jgi:hypothetical protein
VQGFALPAEELRELVDAVDGSDDVLRMHDRDEDRVLPHGGDYGGVGDLPVLVGGDRRDLEAKPFERAGGLWGLRRGSDVVVAATYHDISPLGGGLAHAQRAEEYVYLEATGQVVWEPTYTVHLADADWLFDADQSDLEDAIAANSGPYTFKMVSKDIRWETGGSLEVWRAERRVATIPCQTTFKTVFLIREDTLYYADPAGYTTGCVAGAVRLEDGKHLWRTNLKALWPYGVYHSLYRNEANLRMGEGLLIVSASENNGDYVEALDTLTGRIAGRHLTNDRTSP